MILRSTARALRPQSHRFASTTAPTPPRRPAQSAPPSPGLQQLLAQEQQHLRQPLKDKPLPRGSNAALYTTALVLLLVTPPGVYFWWRHRAEHMGRKKEMLLKGAEEKRRSWMESNPGKG